MSPRCHGFTRSHSVTPFSLRLIPMTKGPNGYNTIKVNIKLLLFHIVKGLEKVSIVFLITSATDEL